MVLHGFMYAPSIYLSKCSGKMLFEMTCFYDKTQRKGTKEIRMDSTILKFMMNFNLCLYKAVKN